MIASTFISYGATQCVALDISDAGTDQTVCATSTTLAGNALSYGTGLWTLVSGTGTLTNATSEASDVTGLGIGPNVFQWTVTNGPCGVATDPVTITRDESPTISAAGSDQTICASTATLAGNVPTVGTGVWSLVSGTGTITSPTSATSGLTGLSVGANVFAWTITNGICSPSIDQVTIFVDENPTVANAGLNQTICSSSSSFTGNNPTIGNGLWTLISGSGTISSPSINNSNVSGLSIGANVFQWTISNGVCPSSSNQVTINRDEAPTVADAGTNQTICATSTNLAGNTPLVGTGVWTLISGNGCFLNGTVE